VTVGLFEGQNFSKAASARVEFFDKSGCTESVLGGRYGFPSRASEEMVCGGWCDPRVKKNGGRAPPRLAINEVLPTNLVGSPRSAGVFWRGRLCAAPGGSASSMEPLRS
jgi:hypothetical protein